MENEVDQLFDILYDLLAMDKEQLTKKLFEMVKAHPEYLLEEKKLEEETKPAIAKTKDLRKVTEQIINIINHVAHGEKIKAIKAYRGLTGTGLKEAKDEIEYMFTNLHL